MRIQARSLYTFFSLSIILTAIFISTYAVKRYFKFSDVEKIYSYESSVLIWRTILNDIPMRTQEPTQPTVPPSLEAIVTSYLHKI